MFNRFQAATRAFRNPALIKAEVKLQQPDMLPRSWMETTFGPSDPVMPLPQGMGPIFAPREIDYPIAANATLQPRIAYGLMPFPTIKNAYDSIAEVSLPVRTMTRELIGFTAQLVNAQNNVVTDHPMQWLIDTPDREISHDIWLTRFIKNSLIYDAGSFSIGVSNGNLYSLDYIDGSTLMLIINERGRLPKPDEVSESPAIRTQYVTRAQEWIRRGKPLPRTTPAFAQVVHGTPFTWWDQDQIWYQPQSRTMDTPYGECFVERAFAWVNLVANITSFELAHYQTGNMPEGWVGAAPDWSPERVMLWENTFNARMTSGPTERMRVRFLPSGFTYHEGKKPDFPAQLYDQAAANISNMIGLPQSEHGKVPGLGLGGKSYSQGQETTLYRNALLPVKTYIEDAFNSVLRRFGIRDIRYRLMLPPTDPDPAQQQESIVKLFAGGIYTLNDSLSALGKDSIPGGDTRIIVSNGNVIRLNDYLGDHPKIEPVPQTQDDVQQSRQILQTAARTGTVDGTKVTPVLKPRISKSEAQYSDVANNLNKVDVIHNDGSMVAIFIPISVALQLRQLTEMLDLPKDATLEQASNMHVTLAYLHNASDQSTILKMLTDLSNDYAPLESKVQGFGVFNGDGKTKVLFALLDSATLPFLRTQVCSGLHNRGIEYTKDHGFVPHITLAYVPVDWELPAGFEVPDTLCSIEAISFAQGERRFDFILNGVYKLEKHCGVCPEDDAYFGAPISREVSMAFLPNEHANGVDIVAMTPPGLPAKPALWKPEGEENPALVERIGGPQYVREEAAYLIDRALGFMLVPVAYVADSYGEKGAAIYYTFGMGSDNPADTYALDWIEKAAVFDCVIGQQDRGQHNWGTHPDDVTRPILFDNGLSFSQEELPVNSAFYELMRGKKLTNATIMALATCSAASATWQDIIDLVGAHAASDAKSRIALMIQIGACNEK